MEENHASVYNADYTGPDSVCYGSIVDNQKNTHLFGIEKIDVSSVAKTRQICDNLFCGETRFTHCYKVTKKQGEASAFLKQSPSKKRKHNKMKKKRKKMKKYHETINFGLKLIQIYSVHKYMLHTRYTISVHNISE